jgi:hypothetical protein
VSAPWVNGGRVWSRVVERHLSAALSRDDREEAALRAMHRCARVWRSSSEALGPASGPSAVWTQLVRPCAEALGWSPGDDTVVTVAGVSMRAAAASLGPGRQMLLAMPWGMAQDGLQRAATRLGAEHDTPWVGTCNGLTWRWYDATRPFARGHVGFDLAHAAIDGRVWQALWLLGQTVRVKHAGRAREVAWLDTLVASSVTEGTGATHALRDGVAATLEQLGHHAKGDHDQHVMLVFQWLFLLFAEARSLVPVWHPAHRRSYALTTIARESAPPRRLAIGVHESLVAIGHLGRAGAIIAGTRIAALNGPLFACSLASRSGTRLTDDQLGAMLAHLTGSAAEKGAAPLDFAQFGVEHLGSLYERLMATPAVAGSPEWLRKRTGAFYTPREMADLIVERTLDPLVRRASSDDILRLRILDPAMGSGALLASTHRYLVAAVEAAWVREGRGGPLDVSRDERERLPRRVAEQCLYGVDVNGRAVQVARLSLWLLSLAPDRPLTWLDAHLRVGNSLIGASPAVILSRAPLRGRTARRTADTQLTLFDLEQWHHEASEVGPLFEALNARPTESAEDARAKSLLLDHLRSRDTLAAWRARADAWCGAAMDSDTPPAGVWRAADDALRANAVRPVWGTRDVEAAAQRWRHVAESQRCLHWSLEFPDVFETGRGGFDAVIANPPWEMLRGDLGSGQERAAQRDDLGPLLRFVRRSGFYRDIGGHVNSYQLFLERMLQLLRTGGRLGCLLPGGFLADHGAAALRTHVFDHAAIDRLSVFDNRDALFPIHRSMRIVSMTGTRGGMTDGVLVDEGVPLRSVAQPARAASAPRLLSRALLRRASGDAEAIPSIRDEGELRVLERVLAWPRLGGEWRVGFGRELNATEDRHLWRSGRRTEDAIPVVDGKHVQPFSVRAPHDGPWTAPADVLRALPDAPWTRWRLAYRDVSSSTNTRSLICALLPPGMVSTHTVFCLRTRLALSSQLYLCGMLNCLVADWYVRRYLGSHVTTRLIASLPVPRVAAADVRRRRVVRLAARLLRSPDDERAQIDLQVTAARLYGLDEDAVAVVAADFPRVSPSVLDGLRRATASTPSTP